MAWTEPSRPAGIGLIDIGQSDDWNIILRVEH